jgi:hypothetical protein
MKFVDILNERETNKIVSKDDIEKALKKISYAFSLTYDYGRDADIAVARLDLTKKQLKPLESKIKKALDKLDIQMIMFTASLTQMGVNWEVPKDKNASRSYDISFQYRTYK